MKSPWRLLSKLILALASFLLVGAIIEAFIFYGLDVKPPGYRPDRFLEFDPQLGWAHKPGARGWWYRYADGSKFMVSINSHGFSDAERQLEKTRPRIAFIGNSTAEFWEVAPEDRGQVVLEELLAERAEVLNLGVRGYGTDQTYLLLESVGTRFAPDIVVLIFCINDIANNASTISKPYFVIDPADSGELILKGCPVSHQERAKEDHPYLRTLDVFAREHSFIYRKCRSLLMTLIGYRWPLETHDDLRPFKGKYDSEDCSRMRLTLHIISEIDAYCRANDIRFLLVGGVTRWEIDMEARDKLVDMYGDIFDFDRVARALDRYTAAHGIEFVSLARLARERGLTASDLMHNEDTIHLDRRGVRFLCESVVERIYDLGWLEPA